MKNIIIFVLLLLSLFFISACNADASSDYIQYSWTDVSNNQFDFSNGSVYSFSNSTINVSLSSGTSDGTLLKNWNFSSLGTGTVTGFEAQVKIGDNMSSCGFEFSGFPSSYTSYWFMLKKDGSFRIELQDYRTESPKTTHLADITKIKGNINLSEFNTVKMQGLQNGRDSDIYINGIYVYTIKDLIVNPGSFAVYFQAAKGTYSSSNKATAAFKIKSIQKRF